MQRVIFITKFWLLRPAICRFRCYNIFNGVNDCPVCSIPVSFIKNCSFHSYKFIEVNIYDTTQKLKEWHKVRLGVSNRLHSYYFQHFVELGHYSNVALGLVTTSTWCWARLLFQHGIGLAWALSFSPTNYEECLHLSE